MFTQVHQFWQENQPVIRKNDEPMIIALVKAGEHKA